MYPRSSVPLGAWDPNPHEAHGMGCEEVIVTKTSEAEFLPTNHHPVNN